MSKKIIQDISPIRRRPIPWSPLPIERKEAVKPELKEKPLRLIKNKKSPKAVRWVSLIVFITSLIFLLSILFSTAKVQVISKTQDIVLDNEKFQADRNGNFPLHFEITIFSDETTKDISLTEARKASSSAKGEITLYNEYSSSLQKLAKGTKIIGTNNLIYLIDKAVTIPGYKIDRGGKVPGSVIATVTAQNVGSEYNGELGDFSIVGFKGTAKFTKIYARPNFPLESGVNGLVYSIGPKEMGELNVFAETTLRDSLVKKIATQVPDGYLFYPTATQYFFDFSPVNNWPTSQAEVKIKGTLTAIILREDELPKVILSRIFPDILETELSEIEIPKLDLFTFNFFDQAPDITKDLKEITFTLSGSDTILWRPDIELLRQNLRGINKKNIQEIFTRDPGIKNASLKIFPPWISAVPTNPSRIKIDLK